MIAVEQRVHEDYGAYLGFIFPLGKAKERRLTGEDLRKAFKEFYRLSSQEKVLAFARKYGLLNNYEVRVKRGGVLISNVFFRDGLKLRYVDPEHDIVFIPLSDRIWIPFREDDKEEGAYIISRGRPVSFEAEGIYIRPLKGLGEAIGFDYLSRNVENDEYIFAEGWEYAVRTLSSIKLAKAYRTYLKNVAIMTRLAKNDYGRSKTELLHEYLSFQREVKSRKKISVKLDGVSLKYDIWLVRKQGKLVKSRVRNISLVFSNIVNAFYYLVHTDDNLRVCPYCGDIFYLESRRGRKNIFCSETCKRKFHYEKGRD